MDETVTTTSTTVETAISTQSYTGGYTQYLYADDWHPSSLSAGDRIYQLTIGDNANTTHYFFGQDTYDKFCSNGEFDAEGLSNYLQVSSYNRGDTGLGDNVYTFRGKVYAYTVKEDTDEVAEAECKANYEWGDGGSPELYVEDVDNLERNEEYDCVATGSIELENGDTVVVASDQEMEAKCHEINDDLVENCQNNGTEHPSEEATKEAAEKSDEARGSTAGSDYCRDTYPEETEDEVPEEKTKVDDEEILAQNGEEDESAEMKETVPDESVIRQNSEETEKVSSVQDDTGGSGGDDPEEEEGPSIE